MTVIYCAPDKGELLRVTDRSLVPVQAHRSIERVFRYSQVRFYRDSPDRAHAQAVLIRRAKACATGPKQVCKTKGETKQGFRDKQATGNFADV